MQRGTRHCRSVINSSNIVPASTGEAGLPFAWTGPISAHTALPRIPIVTGCGALHGKCPAIMPPRTGLISSDEGSKVARWHHDIVEVLDTSVSASFRRCDLGLPPCHRPDANPHRYQCQPTPTLLCPAVFNCVRCVALGESSTRHAV
jgi:hypothetical protein